MNLNTIAEADLLFTLEDTANGFGVDLTFLDSEGEEQTVSCSTTDISYFIDPQTGEGVSSRQVEITARMSTLTALDITVVKGSIVQHYDTAGNKYKSCVKELRPDRKLGVLNMLLEART
ncbi:MAG: hypothetical protein PHS93_07945 [Candidatus Omnitrophica bacterium]|nr:hypothetical protein [Methanocellales archaeon]MDD5353074.1 hypothetical protein [Candidatus Omnitrophota bacterium]